MIDYLENKVSKSALDKIFRKNIDRSIFIGEYRFFGADGNDDFYEEFIKLSISKHRFKVQEDAIELSIALGVFKPSFLIEIKKIIYSRREGMIKLVCLDWLFYFFQNIPESEFIAIDEYVWKNSNDDLLTVQSILNLLLLKADEQLIDNLKLCFTKSDYPAVFYRLINGLRTNQLAKQFTQKTIGCIEEIVMLKQNISQSQKAEIVRKLSDFAKKRLDGR